MSDHSFEARCRWPQDQRRAWEWGYDVGRQTQREEEFVRSADGKETSHVDREATIMNLIREGNRRQAEIERLRALLTPFAEIARRLQWDKIGDDDMVLGEHVIEAPADDIAPGAAYCLMVGAFREAARALEQSTDGR